MRFIIRRLLIKAENDLVISYRAKYFDTEAKEVKQKDASVTVKDFFKKGNDYYVSTRDGYWKEYTDVLGREGKTITGNLNKNNTIKGTAFGDTMTGGNKNDKITTGMGNDIVTTLKGKDTITIDGKGTKTINISQGDGAKTIKGVDKSTKTILQTDFNNDNFSWSQSGKDLVLRNFDLAGGKNDTITIKNYYLDKNGTVNPDVSSKLYYNSNSLVFNSESYYQYKTGKTITSTSEKTLLAGTAKGDNIISNYDADKIYGGKGNDKITLNNGSKTVQYIFGDGNDTILGVSNTTSTNITTPGWGINPYNSRIDAQVTAWSKSNDDVILHFIDTATMKESQITVKDYDVETGTLKVNEGNLTNNREYISGKDITDSGATSNNTVLIGTAKNDKITATKNSWVYAGNGNDEINVTTTSSYVGAGSGNDKIKVTGGGNVFAQSGTNEITLENANSSTVYSGTGKDTVILGGNTGTTVLNFNNRAVDTEGNDVIKFSKDKDLTHNVSLYFKNSNNNLTYKKSGNDLLISEVVKNAKNKNVTETVTIEDYFNPDKIGTSELYLNINDPNSAPVKNVLNQYGLIIPGVANKKTKQTDFTGTDYKDIINGTAKVDNIKTGKGNDVITAGKGNDIITIDGEGTKTINLKKGDGNDTIILGEDAEYVNIVTDADYTPHSKNGDDLLIHRLYMNSDKEVISTEVTTVKDYYKNNQTRTDVITINGSHLSTNSIYYAGKNVTTVAHDDDYYCVAGTKGADTMNLAGYNDVYAGAGNDNITASGYSNIYAGAGNDTITTTGTAHIYGGAGNDTITTSCYGEGSCTIYGGAGNDTIIAKGKAYIEDGAGDDTITVSDLDTNYWSCFGDLQDGEGNDTFNLKTCASLDLNSGKNTVIVDSKGQTLEQTHVYSGAGDDTMIFKGASNSVWFNMANHNVIDEGNDTVIFEENPTHKVVIQVFGDETYTKKGNDLIITDYHTNAKGKTISENVTVKDFFIKPEVQNKLYLNGASESYDTIAESLSSYKSVNITGVANKKTKQTDFTGSQFNDTVTGTAKVDNIITNAGNDMITAGKGNDIITIDGTGTKTINIANGDGKDTVKFKTTGTTANFVYNQNDAISWSQSGDNLILSRTYDSGSKVLTEQTVVEGYFAEGFGNTIQVNGTDFSAETFAQLVSGRASKVNKVEITTAQNYIGGSKNDDITINANAEVFAGAGADKITIKSGNATVHAGAGNDTVTVEGGSDIKFVHNSGDGNDTIIFSDTPDSVNLSVDMKITEAELDSALQSGRLGFVKSGNDLRFSVPNGKKAEIITVKDYFAGESKKPANFNANLFMSGQGIGSLSLNELMKYWGLGIAGVTDKNKVTTFEGTDNLMNTMNARGLAKAKMYGGYFYDVYTTDLNKNSQIYIQDKDVFVNEDGDEVLNYEDADLHATDRLLLNAKQSDIRMFFNVSSYHNEGYDFYTDTNIIVTDPTSDFDSMVFFDKKSFTLDNLRNVLSDNGKATGCIQIDDYFARQKTVGDSEVLQTPTDFRGEGYIEDVYTGKGMYDTNMDDIYQDEWMRNIKYDVAQWFASDGISSKGYTSVIDVIEKGIANSDMTDAKAVLALYQNSDYTQIPM